MTTQAMVSQVYEIDQYDSKENITKKVEVTGEVYGYFGIHYNEKTTLYSITHIPTGRLLEAFYSKDIAKKFVSDLANFEEFQNLDFSRPDVQYFLDLPKEKKDLIKHFKDIYSIEDYNNTPDDEDGDDY